jgi:hypothetical protein
MIMSAKVDLLDNQRLIGQLCGLERRTGRGGRDSVDHRAGARDDLANAVCGVFHLAREPVHEKFVLPILVSAPRTYFGDIGGSIDAPHLCADKSGWPVW